MHAERDPEAESADSSSDVTGWLRAWRGGDAASGERLIAALYNELRAMARQRLRGERRQITLQTTALVHETYLRLLGNNRRTFHDRPHFLALSATVMRRALAERARERPAATPPRSTSGLGAWST